MDDSGIMLSWGTLLGVLGFLLTVGVNIAIIAVWSGGITARLRQVESHGEKVDQIAPLKASLEALERSFGLEIKNMRDDLRDLASSVRDLARARAA